ncbi:LysM peptidoglycan-binding domain-containing protein [Aggregatilinea lenta]|uniref:LysM peptidoglycan-binding domain-containing protein n=1 Tax=Aggregatilinea lenta TaxID=913108 RepID=UPI0013C2E8A1|nr:LysM peptidoglycan-binding domain-containing protein [Aggregatilinea lenta]
MSWATRTSTLHRPLLLLGITLLLAAALLLQPSAALAQGGPTHTVQSGENLFRIALQYGTTVDALAMANGITNAATIYAGQVLLIPSATGPVSADTAGYVVPLDGAYGTTVQPVVQQPAVQQPVETAPVQVASAATTSGTHIVARGETLASIARAYGVSWTDIAAANGIASPNLIYAGQQLAIPNGAVQQVAAPVTIDPAPAAAQPVAASASQGTYTVQAGEGLASIASRYGLSWPDLAAANNIGSPYTIYSGQVLVIPAGGSAIPQSYAPAPAQPTTSVGKDIVVDLSDQRVYAYENGQLVRNVLVSTGLYNTPTVQGTYRIYVKYDSQAMSGPGYYLPGVPYVMYFYQGYSLHGTYWHNNFGQPMSHGCVNLPTPEAAWFYGWAEIGTPVHVQY